MNRRSMDIVHPKYDSSMKEEPPKPNTNTPAKPVPSNNSTGSSQPSSNPPKRKDVFWPVYLIGVLVVAVIVFFGVRAASSLVDVWTDLSPTSVNESTANNSDTTTTTDNSSTDTTSTDTTATTDTTTDSSSTANTVATPTIDKASLKIKILNGNGVSGAADTAKGILEKAGFTIDSTGNAKQFNYDTTLVYFPTGKDAPAKLVADALTGYQVSTEENSVADGFDALVVIGKK